MEAELLTLALENHLGGSFSREQHPNFADCAVQILADVEVLKASHVHPTWCREHHTYDQCPEYCARCRGYFHGDSSCMYANATDQGGPMPGFGPA